jgi:hypothetical protein
MSIILSSMKWGQMRRPINACFKLFAKVGRPLLRMLSTILSRAWIQGSMPYCVPKDGTPGSEHSLLNQEVNTASKSRSKCMISLIFIEFPQIFHVEQ